VKRSKRKRTKICKPSHYEVDQDGMTLTVKSFGWVRHGRESWGGADYYGFTGDEFQHFAVIKGGFHTALYPWHIRIFEGYTGDITQRELAERRGDLTCPNYGVYRREHLALALHDAVELCKPTMLQMHERKQEHE
jgi:hypothetical protein